MAFSIKGIGAALGDVPIKVASISEDFQKAIAKTGISTVFESSVTAFELALRACSDLQNRIGLSLEHDRIIKKISIVSLLTMLEVYPNV